MMRSVLMRRSKQNTFNKKVIDALLHTPGIVLAPTKRKRRKAAKKWLNVLTYASKH